MQRHGQREQAQNFNDAGRTRPSQQREEGSAERRNYGSVAE
jgi:hypothetical protein